MIIEAARRACHGSRRARFNVLNLQIYKAFRVKPAVLANVLRCCGGNRQPVITIFSWLAPQSCVPISGHHHVLGKATFKL